MHRSLDFYFDFISPFGYLASLRVDELATRHQRECRWQSMLLGISVLKIMGMQPLTQIPLKGDYLRIDLERYLRQHKLTLARTRDMTPSNPIPAGRADVEVEVAVEVEDGGQGNLRCVLAPGRRHWFTGGGDCDRAARWRRRGWVAARPCQR